MRTLVLPQRARRPVLCWRAAGRPRTRLKRQVPLYFVYITAWASEDGVVQFRDDIYERDGVDELAMQTNYATDELAQ